jgi:hypothetical protein
MKMTRLIVTATATAGAILMAVSLFANFAAAPHYELLIWIAISSALASVLCFIVPITQLGGPAVYFPVLGAVVDSYVIIEGLLRIFLHARIMDLFR